MLEGQGNTEPLELTANERDIIRVATENFDKVIVLVNCVNAMELGELQDNDKIDYPVDRASRLLRHAGRVRRAGG